MNIAIMEPLGITPEELSALKAPLEARGCIFTEHQRTSDPSELIANARDADVMVLANMPIPGEVLRACDRLKLIDVAFTGLDHIPLDVARERGIVVKNAAGYSDEAVAELALGMVLSLSRRLPEMSLLCRTGGSRGGFAGREIRGKTVGIIGLGRIGMRTAELFHALGADILAQSRSRHGDVPGYIRQVPQEELLAQSDIVILHCPLNDSTRGMIDREKLAMMKPSALLINVARGPVVVASDLADALDRGVIAGAGVDVFDVEPPVDPAEPLLHAKNILLTPHIAFATQESMLLRAQIVFDNLAHWLQSSRLCG